MPRQHSWRQTVIGKQHRAGRHAAMKTHLTACEIVALAEMVGSTMTLGSAKGTASTGSARLVDMTAHQNFNVCLLGCNVEASLFCSAKTAVFQHGCGQC